MAGIPFTLVDAFLLAILPVAAGLLATAFYMLRRRQQALEAASAELAREHDRVRLALEGSSLTIWDWDVASDSIWLNANWRAMLGGAPEETRGPIAGLFDPPSPLTDRFIAIVSLLAGALPERVARVGTEKATVGQIISAETDAIGEARSAVGPLSDDSWSEGHPMWRGRTLRRAPARRSPKHSRLGGMTDVDCLSEEQVTALRAEVIRRGLKPIAAELGVSREGLASVIAGVARRGTIALVRAALPRLAPPPTAALPHPPKRVRRGSPTRAPRRTKD